MIPAWLGDAQTCATDPLLVCFQPGVPRATLLPEPFQIFQQRDRVVTGKVRTATRGIS